MRTRRFYFDTHVFSLLADPHHTGVADGLQAAVDQNEVEVLGSLELLGELVPRAATDPEACHRMVSLFWRLCGRCILRPWYVLVRDEVRKRNRLSYREAYLPVDVINAAPECSQNELTHEEWADGVRQRKDKYLARMTTEAGEFEKLAVEKWGPRGLRKFASQLTIDRERVREWGRDFLIRPDPARHGLSLDQTTWPDISVLPCASAYIGITVAWRRKCHLVWMTPPSIRYSSPTKSIGTMVSHDPRVPTALLPYV